MIRRGREKGEREGDDRENKEKGKNGSNIIIIINGGLLQCLL